MIFATRRNGSRDGELIVVAKSYAAGVSAKSVVSNLQAALDNWHEVEEPLQVLYNQLNSNKLKDIIPIDICELQAPLPRAYAWLDGSAYLNHVILTRKARGGEIPTTLLTDPLMYQGCSNPFLSPTEDIFVPHFRDLDAGLDFESEVVIITDDVPMGIAPQQAHSHVKLLTLCNDITLRNRTPAELAKGFGFLQSKPPSALAPFALTPDELGATWQKGRVHLPLESWLNGNLIGNPEAGNEMHFSFFDLIAHAAQTRPLAAGTVIGGGTVSNEDPSRGSSCLVERRFLEKLQTGQVQTPFLQGGDRIRIEMKKNGISLFGAIDQKVTVGHVLLGKTY
jgi:fumarylacetoacetate (FAA) hydrolase